MIGLVIFGDGVIVICLLLLRDVFVFDSILICDEDVIVGCLFFSNGVLIVLCDLGIWFWEVFSLLLMVFLDLLLNVKKLIGLFSSLFVDFLISLVFVVLWGFFFIVVGFLVNVCGINGLFVSLIEGLLGLFDFSVMLCFGLGRSVLRFDFF